MLNICRQIKRAIRYWIFPDSRIVEQGTYEIGRLREQTKSKVWQTEQIVRRANQPDTLRNLMIAMTSDSRRQHPEGH